MSISIELADLIEEQRGTADLQKQVTLAASKACNESANAPILPLRMSIFCEQTRVSMLNS